MTPRRVAAFILLMLNAVANGGDTQDAPVIRVDLEARGPTETLRVGYSRPRSVMVEIAAPRFLFKVPAFRAKDPLFFRVSLGQTEGIPFYGALDRSEAGDCHDLLYLDLDRDLDLTNDGEPVAARVRTLWETGARLVEFLDLRLPLPYTIGGEVEHEPYPCVVYYVLEKGETPATVQVERDGWREGRVTLPDGAYRLALLDDDSDGKFTTGDSWVLRPVDADPKDMLARAATRSMIFPAWSADQKSSVEVVSVDLAGRTASLRIAPATETEDEFFLRVYRERQTPEERELNIDPLRPKADEQQGIEWMTGRDVAYALEIAASPNVRKRVLVEFLAPDCVWCDRMQRLTFRDREVVEICRNFVCARVPFQPGTPDTSRYGVEGTPTYIVLGMDGAEITRQSGFARPTDFAAWLKGAMR